MTIVFFGGEIKASERRLEWPEGKDLPDEMKVGGWRFHRVLRPGLIPGWIKFETAGEDGAETETCGTCNGEGEHECHYCEGDGVLECEECEGSGEVDVPKEEAAA